MTQIDTVSSTPLGKTKMSGPFQECRIQEWVQTSLVFPRHLCSSRPPLFLSQSTMTTPGNAIHLTATNIDS